MSHLERAQLLVNQQRFDMAEQVLGEALAKDPQDAVAHLLMAICYRQTDRLDQATQCAEQAVHLAPHNARCHAILGSVLMMRNRLDEAESAFDEAMRLDPFDVVNHQLLANLHFLREHWKQALEFAESGLQIDPDDSSCRNFRALSLERLGKGDVAVDAAREALSRNPDDSASHATHGWALLNQGKFRESQEAFREALRLEPNNEFAKQGMIKALNANNIIFRLVLRWYTLMGRMSPNARWAVILGLFFGQRLLRQLGKQIPSLQPWVAPIVIAYALFAIMTWVADPLFNTFLRFNRFGRYLLDRSDLAASNVSCIIFLLGIGLGTLISFVAQSPIGLLLGVGFSILMLMPVSATFKCDAGYPFHVMATVSSLLGLIGLAFLILPMFGLSPSPGLAGTFFLGVVASQFLANYLMSVRVAR